MLNDPTTPRTHSFINHDGTVTEIFGTHEDAINARKYITGRKSEYNIELQLDMLYKDIEAGLFGESAKAGQFASYIRDIKNRHPK